MNVKEDSRVSSNNYVKTETKNQEVKSPENKESNTLNDEEKNKIKELIGKIFKNYNKNILENLYKSLNKDEIKKLSENNGRI